MALPPSDAAADLMKVSPLAAAEALDAPPPPPPPPPRASWRDADKHDDAYGRCLRHAYFPLLVARPRAIVAAWVVVLVVSAFFGLGIAGASKGFLNSTRSNLDLPKGTPSGDAVLAFQSLYPTVSSWAPVVIVLHAAGGSGAAGGLAVSPHAKNASAALDAFAAGWENGTVVSYVTGFFEFEAMGLSALAQESLSPDNRTALVNIGFQRSTTLDKINLFVDAVIPFADGLSTPHVSVAATGLFPLFRQMSLATEASFSTIDGTVIPIAMVILGFRVRSYRHIGIALINLIIALLLSFAVLTPVAVGFDINPFAPSIMLSLGVAVCFDYSLFLVTRFREERLLAFKSREDAVFETMLTAGHVVLLSGGTLTATFVILLFFKQNFLQSVGYSCSVTTAASVIVNLSMTPALLLACDCMSFFDPCPRRAACCCRVPSLGWSVPAEDPAEAARAARAAADAAAEASGEKAAALRARETAARNASGPAVARARGAWCFSLPWAATSAAGRWLTMAFVVLLTAPFLAVVLKLTPTSDDYLIYLQGSSTLEALSVQKSAFPEGLLSPYDIIFSTGTAGGVLTANYFAAERAVIHDVLARDPGFVDASSFESLSFFQGQDVDFVTAQAYLNPADPLFSSPRGAAWRSVNWGKMNSDKSASLVKVETIVNPQGQAIVPFIKDVRGIISGFSAPAFPALQIYLFGGYTTTMDVQDMLYAVVPADIGAVVALVLVTVALSFRSVGLAARLIVTLALSLVWTFGFSVLVYQPGQSQRDFSVISPTILASSGIYWIIPIMSFSILVGLAMDYDIFLISRVREFRELGWSDRAAACLAVEKTGGVITAAGLIMCVSFMGLLIPKTVVLNQYGFTLFIGVAFDTFVIRPIVVPAIITILGSASTQANWWPSAMPVPLLSEADEDHALAAGCWDPRELV